MVLLCITNLISHLTKMSLEPIEQLKSFLEKSKDVLVLIPENPSGDAVGSAWALYHFLQKKNISVTVAFSNHLAEKYSYLSKPENILSEISGARDFVLSFDTTRNKITNLRSEQLGDKFNVYLTPEKGTIDPRDFSFILAKFKYDLVIVLDVPDLEKLGKIYEKNTDLFFEVPVVNIDHRTENENFGQINLVDVLASSCSEIITNLLENINPELIDKTIADCLLTGIISATESFQKNNTTPRALLASAKLMDRGANQQEIVRWLYKTHPLHILKLWGRTMANIKWDESSKLIWSELTLEDFVQSRSKPEDVSTILEKLQENYSDGEIFMIFWNTTQDSGSGQIKSADLEFLTKLQAFFGGTLKRNLLEISFTSNNLTDAGVKLSQKIKEIKNQK